MRTPSRSRRRRTSRAAALVLVAATALTACTQSEPETTPAKANVGHPLDLAGVCPDPVVIQSDWAPESEHGAQYQLVGDEYEIDARAKSVRGPLVASGGKDTGVDVEVRAGGPAAGFEPAADLMNTDPDITLGAVTTDDAVGVSGSQRVVGVVTPLEIDPQIIMWDPETHPEFQTISDIGQTDTRVLYFKGRKYMDYLIGSGILKRDQVDDSYDGQPSRFVASKGNIAQQGFATDEPFYYEKLLEEWGKPVAFQLVHETGYPIYPSVLSVRADRLSDLAPCLRKLVPIIQQAQVDYARDPGPVNELLVEAAAAYDIDWDYTAPRAEFSIRQQLELGIVGNGDDDTLGDFDPERVQRLIDIVRPIFNAQGIEVATDLAPSEIATNRFIDETIGLPR